MSSHESFSDEASLGGKVNVLMSTIEVDSDAAKENKRSDTVQLLTKTQAKLRLPGMRNSEQDNLIDDPYGISANIKNANLNIGILPKNCLMSSKS